MFSQFVGNASQFSLVAVFGEYRVRVRDAYLETINMDPPKPERIFLADNYHRCKLMRTKPTRIEITAIIRNEGMVIEMYDPLAPVPIGSKTVDECTNDELLFALQYRLGILLGGKKNG